jgi:hypothetical protein
MSWSQIQTILKDAQGRLFTNPAKEFIRPFELPMDKPNKTITIPAGQQAGPIPFTAKLDGPIEIFFIKVLVTDDNDTPVTSYDIDCQIEHAGKKVILSNRVMPLSAVSGDAGRPYVLPETIFIPAVQSINITFFNRDTQNDRKVTIVMGGIKYYHQAAPAEIRRDLLSYVERRERTYTYWLLTDSLIVLDASETERSCLMTIPDDADMEVFKMTSKSSGAYEAEIKDSEYDRSLTAGVKLHCSLLFGGHDSTALADGLGGSGGVYPAKWATSLLLRRSGKFEILVNNLTNSQNTIKPVFGGRKISYAP